MDDEQLKKAIDYWLTSAEYDVDVAKSLFKKKKYHYSLFFGHLTLEKVLKAIYIKKKSAHAPITHSLPYLVEKAELEIDSERLERLAEYMEFYIEGRYPKDLEAVFKKCNRPFTKKKLKEITEMFEWLKRKFITL
jgi:HEPN domain-containing protein